MSRGLGQELISAHLAAGLPEPDQVWLASLDTRQGSPKATAIRFLTRAYVDKMGEIQSLHRTISDLESLRDRVLIAESALHGGAAPSLVQDVTRLTDAQMDAVIRGEPVQP